MKPYRELWWPRFWPFLRVVDEMPSHRINITTSVIWYGVILPTALAGSWLITLCATFLYVFVWIWGPFRFLPAPPRKASNYGVSIVIRRDVLRNEPWVLQQEIYESRYWLAHPWRLVDFFWFYRFALNQPADSWLVHRNWTKSHRAAAHLSRVEAASRAQEIRAYYAWFLGHHGHPSGFDIDNLSRRYAESIHGAKNYPFLKAAGWDEERVYQEIVRHL